jgi:hypothetical protein
METTLGTTGSATGADPAGAGPAHDAAGSWLTAPSEDAAVELLHQLFCTDGLPVIVPTPERVDRMVLASGLDRDLVLAEMGPALGAASVEKVAAAAVMAGCLPDHMPVVMAAVLAVTDPTFDLTEMQATTHNVAPLLIVNGPLTSVLGIHGGFGALGPGFRANAAIGRALRLAMINIGGGRAGSSDMALLGHPGKYTYCLAEHEAVSPWQPLHVARGFDRDQSVVTVVGVEAPHSVIAVSDADTDPGGERILQAVARCLASLSTNNAMLGGGTAVVVLNPDHAAALARAGLSRADVQQAVYQRAANPRSVVAAQAPGMRGKGEPDDLLRCFASPDDVCVLVAGGGGLYSTVMPSWCAGPHRSRAVSRAIELDQACEIPGSRLG